MSTEDEDTVELFSDGLIPEGENEQFRLPDGTVVGTGNLRIAGGPQETLRSFPQELLLEDGEIQKLLARKTIKEARAARQYRMRNQGQIGSCCPVSVVSCFEQTQEVTGRPHTALQPEHLYMNINGGSDSGALLERAMRRMITHGCASAGKVPYQAYNRRQASNVAAADEDGKRFLMHEPFAIPTDYKTYCRTVASCIARDWPVEIAWHVTGATMRLINGFAVVGRGPGNHASYLHWAEWIGGETLIRPDLANSWGPTQNVIYGARSNGWGENGYAKIQLDDVYATRRYHQHFAVTSISDDPQGNNPV
jgi:hypothetical protein